MNKVFEDEFMDVQSSIISLCLELTERKVDKVYAYCSNEKYCLIFNANYKYEEVCSANTGKDSVDVFWEWIAEVKAAQTNH